MLILAVNNLAVNSLAVNSLAVNGALPLYVVSRSVFYTLYSVKKCLLDSLSVLFRGGRGGGVHGAAPEHDRPRHGERSRLQLLLKLAGAETRLISGWLFKFGCLKVS